jgi:DNA-binding transcriptional LysR family regulator
VAPAPTLRPSGWVGVELRHFLALEAVASEASFHRAAERLGYTQSAISQQIATLEKVIGQRLIERPGGSQPVRLTRAGEIVMEHAHAIGARLATAQADLKALDAGGLEPLRLGFFGHGLGALMPGIMSQLEQARPETVLRVLESRDGEELASMLRRGEADVAFVYLPLSGDEWEHVVLLEDDYVLVVRPDSPLAKRSTPPTADEIAALQLIGLKPVAPCQLDAFFQSHNLEPTWVVGSHDIETIYAFVIAGTGAALLPRLATLSLGADATVVELGGEIPPRRIGLAWSAARQPSELVDAFVRAAKAEAARLTRTTACLSVAS